MNGANQEHRELENEDEIGANADYVVDATRVARRERTTRQNPSKSRNPNKVTDRVSCTISTFVCLWGLHEYMDVYV